MEPTFAAARHPNSEDASSEQVDDGVAPRFILWAVRHNTILTIVAASVGPILYLFFVDHYATNSFYGDDWSVSPFVYSALHGHLSLSALWGQYNESRLFLGNVVDVLFGVVDGLNLRTVVFFSAALLIASYAVLLALFRRYVGRRLTPIPVIVIGVIWFSLADVQNSLWAFQVSWYLTVFFLLLTLFALLVPDSRRVLWFSIGVLAAVAASLATVQGFLCWPLGAICILWNRTWVRQAALEIAIWLGTALIAAVWYFRGYDFNKNGCHPAATCSTSSALHHPIAACRFLFALIGNVVPGGSNFINNGPVHSVSRFEILGAALFAVAVFILVQSWRYRISRERLPLPLLLISFSLLFDVTVALNRSGKGPTSAITSDRYLMANLILLTGIVIYALSHIPSRPRQPAIGTWRLWVTSLAMIAFAVFLILQVTVATDFGLINGRATKTYMVERARFYVNLDRVPKLDAICEFYVEILTQPGASVGWSTWFPDAREGQLGEFGPSSYDYYRRLGLPPLYPQCRKTART